MTVVLSAPPSGMWGRREPPTGAEHATVLTAEKVQCSPAIGKFLLHAVPGLLVALGPEVTRRG